MKEAAWELCSHVYARLAASLSLYIYLSIYLYILCVDLLTTLAILSQALESRLSITLPDDLPAALSDGVVLCHLVNHVTKSTIPVIHVPSAGMVSRLLLLLLSLLLLKVLLFLLLLFTMLVYLKYFILEMKSTLTALS